MYRTPPLPFPRHLVAISASHRKGRLCLAGAPGSGSSSLSGAAEITMGHCIALQSSLKQTSPSYPTAAAAAAQDQALTPQQNSKEQHSATSHSCCVFLPRSSGNRKKEAKSRELLSQETVQCCCTFSSYFSLLNNNDKVIDRLCGTSQPARHCIHIHGPTPLALGKFLLHRQTSGNGHYHKFDLFSVFFLTETTHKSDGNRDACSLFVLVALLPALIYVQNKLQQSGLRKQLCDRLS